MQVCKGQDEPQGWSRIGLRMGIGFSGILGGAIQSPKPLFGYSGALFQRVPLEKKKKLNFYYELSARFKGSKFKVNEGIDSLISRISLFYIETPVALMHKIGETNQRSKYVYWGFQPAVLLRSSVFRGNRNVPVNQGNLNIPLRTMDYSIVLGLHQEGIFSGYNVSVKYGIRNINKGLDIKDNSSEVYPKLSKDDVLRNLSVDVSFTF